MVWLSISIVKNGWLELQNNIPVTQNKAIIGKNVEYSKWVLSVVYVSVWKFIFILTIGIIKMHRIDVKLLLNSGQCPQTRWLVADSPETIKTSWCRHPPTLSYDPSACEQSCVWKMIKHTKDLSAKRWWANVCSWSVLIGYRYTTVARLWFCWGSQSPPQSQSNWLGGAGAVVAQAPGACSPVQPGRKTENEKVCWCQETFGSLLRYPWARCWTPRCSEHLCAHLFVQNAACVCNERKNKPECV